VQDEVRRSVVRLERDDPRARKILVEAEDVLDLRPAPPVDGLVFVADGAERLRPFPQKLDERVLRGVGVLVLVDEEMADPRNPSAFPRTSRRS
jgi:hypothetical protein